jgi:inorganic pyrophosphatase
MTGPPRPERGGPRSAQVPRGHGHFEVYKDLDPGKSVEGAHWVGRQEAEEEITNSIKRLAESGKSH